MRGPLRSSVPRLATAAALAVVAATGGLASAVPAGAAVRIPTYTYIGVSRVGHAVYIRALSTQGASAATARPSVGHVVYLQRRVGVGWLSMLSRPLDANGRTIVGFNSSVLAVYRWFAPAQGGAAASASPPAVVGPYVAPPPKPGPTNTGVPRGTALRLAGNLTLSTPGQVVSGLDIRGTVLVRARNVVIKNSVLRGERACVWAALDVAPGANALVQDSEIAVQFPCAGRDAVAAWNTTLLRVNIHGGVDGVKAFDNVVVRSSYIHDLAYFASDPAQGGGPTHNDAVQTYGGNQNIVLAGNTITLRASDNAAWQVTQNEGRRATNLVVTGNWLDGGGCTLNFSHYGGPVPMTSIFVTNNRFGRHSQYQCPILLSTRTVLSALSGNVWDDTGRPIPAPQRHD